MPATDDYIGKTVASKYRIEQMIGEGGMGRVYRATQLALDKPVVLKVLRQALVADERTVARFQREAKAASRLNHPNSISVVDFGQSDDGAYYIAMEYVQGKDLHHILSREWPLPEARVIRIMSQVLSALADAHSAAVIHRDLKPENIMVEQRRGEADFVKVLDFGIAKIIDGSNDDGPALTRAGFVCGTPEYMSPEQARGAQLDHRSDLYAVGVILYQLTAGVLPFDSDSAVGFATKHLTEQPLPPGKKRPDARVSAAMERLIMRALAKDPAERPQTAEQFRAELLAIEKERRAAVSQHARLKGSQPSMKEVVRTVPPLDQQGTRLTTDAEGSRRGRGSPWQKEETVRAGPVPHPTGPEPAPTTDPQRAHGGDGVAALVFKVATVLLVAMAVGLAGVYVWQTTRSRTAAAPVAGPVEPVGAPWELTLSAEQRRPADSARLAADGDAAVLAGNLSLAEQRYQEAWRADTTPELALKLGELMYQQNRLADAAAWWKRYQVAVPDSRARVYLEQTRLADQLGPAPPR